MKITRLEFIVVVIILGVLGAIALPNLLEGCVAKSINSEGKNAVGTLNRGQYGYHFEKYKFASNIQELGVTLPESK